MRRPMALHALDMLGPGVEEGHILAGLSHVRAGIAADGAGADYRNPGVHGFLRAG